MARVLVKDLKRRLEEQGETLRRVATQRDEARDATNYWRGRHDAVVEFVETMTRLVVGRPTSESDPSPASSTPCTGPEDA